MILFRTLEIILPCSELSNEAASIRGRHAVSERTEEEAAMRSMRVFADAVGIAAEALEGRIELFDLGLCTVPRGQDRMTCSGGGSGSGRVLFEFCLLLGLEDIKQGRHTRVLSWAMEGRSFCVAPSLHD